MNNSVLDQQRAAMAEPNTSSKNQARVWKMFNDSEKVEAIKGNAAFIMIGSGDEKRTVKIRPLNPKTLVTSYDLIKQILLPLVKTFEPNADGSRRDVRIDEILSALGDNIDKLPELIFIILKRGNEISREWVDENLDILLDLQLIIPIFMQQNGLMKLMGNDQAPVNPVQSEMSPQTAA